jgi:hypothetical protein
VVDVAGVEQRRPSQYSRPHGGADPWHQGRASTAPFGLRWCIGSNRCGAVERMLLMSLWCRTAAEIAANSGVPAWLNASASTASSGQIRSNGLIDTGPATIATT